MWQIDWWFPGDDEWSHWDELFPMSLDKALAKVKEYRDVEKMRGYESPAYRLTNVETHATIML